jgi:hypothetical protein
MVNTRSMSRTQTETLSSLANPRATAPNVVQTFQGFSARRASMGPLPEESASTAPSRDHPTTPMRPTRRLSSLDREGGGPPDGDDSGDDEGIPDDPFDEDPGQRVFNRLADAISDLAHRNEEGSSSNKPSSNAPDLTGKLGKDGKLTAEEHKRRLDNRLCLFCAGMGHSARDCPKSTSRAAKGRAATTTPASTSAPKQETKPAASTEAKK